MISPLDRIGRWLRGGDRSGRNLGRIGSLSTGLLFWGAIVLPVFYLPLLATGIDDVSEFRRFLVLVGMHVVTLIGGHSFRSRSDG